jgi:tripartite ATP-independent transporter DctP family solute receptor
MKKSKISLALCIIMIFTLVFTGCGGSGSGSGSDTDTGNAKAETITCSLGSVAAETSVQIQAAKMFADKVKEYTDGSVVINVFPAGQIGSDESMAEDMERGTLEFSFLNQGSCAGLDQMLDFHYLPFIATNYEEADKLFYGDGVIPTTLKETLANHKITVLGWYENEFRGLSNSKHEVKTAADMKGLKLRVPGSAAIKGFFTEAGAQTVTIAMPELYTALQQKTVDGQDNGVLITHDNKLEENNKYYTYLKHVYAMSAICVSDAAWSKFSDDQKAAIEKAAQEVQPWEIKATRDQIDQYLDTMKQNGVTVTELTDADVATFMPAAEKTWESMKSVYGADKIEQLKAEVAAVRGE